MALAVKDMTAKQMWISAFQAWQANRPACTLARARALLAKHPRHGGGWIVLGDVLTDLARYDEARLALDKAMRYCPPTKWQDIILSRMGKLHREKGSYRIAERWYRKAVASSETTANLVFLGACLAKQGRFSEAKRCHCRAIKVATTPTDEAYSNLGLILRAEEKYDDALECFKKALKIDPKDKLARDAAHDLVRLKEMKQRKEAGSGGHVSTFDK